MPFQLTLNAKRYDAGMMWPIWRLVHEFQVSGLNYSSSAFVNCA